MSAPKDRRGIRPPTAAGAEESVGLGRAASVPDRPASAPPPATKRTQQQARRAPDGIPPDPRIEEGRGVFTERVRATIDALGASMPEPPPPDRAQRIEALVRELACSGPDSDAPTQARLLALGAEALPAVARAFPGALWIDLGRPHRPLRSARELSAVAACLAAFGERAAPFLPPLLRAHRPEVRFAACVTAGDLAHDALVAPLAARLWDDVPAVRDAAARALWRSAQLPAMLVLRHELVSALDDPSAPAKWRAQAAWTLGQLRDAGAARLLVEQLGAEREVARSAREALVLLIGRDLGRWRLRWRRFFAEHGDDRVEWLARALEHADPEVRTRALHELILATGEGFDRRHAVATREGARELAAFYRALAAR